MSNVKKLCNRGEIWWRSHGEDKQYAIVVTPGAGWSAYIFNPTATMILIMCDGTYTIEDIIQHISKRYKVDYEVVKRDVLTFIEVLEKLGIVRLKSMETE